MRSFAIERTISGVKTPGALTPINTSAPINASASKPVCSTANCCFSEFRSDRLFDKIPLESQMTIFSAPALCSKRAIAIPAAPAPLITRATSDIALFTTLRALTKAAKVTIAVPCWSSWKIGISNS